jgi:hypothetical protein
MTTMTLSDAVAKLRESLLDEDAIVIDDGADMWEISCLLDAVRASEDGTLLDLAVSEDGIVRINPDGYLEGYLYRVVPRPGSYVWELRKNGRTLLARAYQSARDMATNGRGEMLAAMIPDEHVEFAQEGEWNPEGLVYEANGDYYVLSCQKVLDEDPDETGPSERYVCWVMENGHKHGFTTCMENWKDEASNVPSHAWEGVPLANQGDYAAAVMERECTVLKEVREYAWTDDGLTEAVANGDLEILNETGGYIDLDDEDDARRVAEFGGLAAWTRRYGVEVP